MLPSEAKQPSRCRRRHTRKPRYFRGEPTSWVSKCISRCISCIRLFRRCAPFHELDNSSLAVSYTCSKEWERISCQRVSHYRLSRCSPSRSSCSRSDSTVAFTSSKMRVGYRKLLQRLL